MDIEEGDILQAGGHFFRVYTMNPRKHEVVFNKIIWNPTKGKNGILEIFHDYEFCKFDEIGDGKKYTHFKSDDPEVIKLLEIPKRKYKIQRLNQRGNEA